MIKDYEFIKSDEVPGPTKEEIRCLIKCKSEVSSEDIVLEIGCGTGGITSTLAEKCKEVIAIDKNPRAINITSQNLEKFNLSKKVKLIEDDALSFLNSEESLKYVKNVDIAIIGGSNNDLEDMIDSINSKLNKNGKIIITAILIDTKIQAITKVKNSGFKVEIVEINVSKGKIMERGTMMIAQNPIAIITATKS
ncbi:putative cobalt-precorrin-6Y C(15)-methyltransferase [Methanobrevibacter cuticularis]|uniref:Probable cobalt-precorrin-6B C(15)-methyltransferase (decarboxylating) n=1 Tax=Methanobrevibacter cuticularis TaxID=47311 RepID=A0A166CHU9_9EURY|nr:precorrin-6Y C5,15-methyltransferase (decarboxylating) subunit CbiT [Methanobrevibacter cuticularis]KZX14522.1 putative cobalt-precorrin-6Y C(15)-methyltransferase [Methanobrevibacter cuticularis]